MANRSKLEKVSLPRNTSMSVIAPSRTPSPNLFSFQQQQHHHQRINSIPEEEKTNMGIMLEATINVVETKNNKRPIHALDISCHQAGMNKRGKVFSFFPSVETNYNNNSVVPHADTTTNTLEQDDTSDGSSSRVPSPPITAVGGCGDAATTPTADDYANLLFCESSEEDDVQTTNLVTKTEPSKNNDGCNTASTRTRRESTTTTSSSSSSTRKNKRRRRRVSFGASIPTFHHLNDVPPAHAMTPDERSTSWYSRSDLEMLKSSAQSSIQDMRSRIIKAGASSEYGRDRSKFRSMMTHMEHTTGSSIRGLEHRVFRRKQTRQMLIREVLECQSHFKGLARFGHEMDGKEKAMLLAKVSRERSVRARSVAFVDAKDDYDEVYGNVNINDDGCDNDENKHQKKQARQVSLVSLS